MPQGKGYTTSHNVKPSGGGVKDARVNAGRSQGNTADGVPDRAPETRAPGHKGKNL